jgi:hypothetical protein
MTDGPPPTLAELIEMRAGPKHPTDVRHTAAVWDGAIPAFGRDGGLDRLRGDVDPRQSRVETVDSKLLLLAHEGKERWLVRGD